jgi:hypothetical protein
MPEIGTKIAGSHKTTKDTYKLRDKLKKDNFHSQMREIADKKHHKTIIK